MNILFYVDPWIELNDPNFRYNAIAHRFEPMIRVLTDNNKISVICNDFVRQKLLVNKILPSTVDILSIDLRKLSNSVCSGYLDFSLKFNGPNYTENDLENIKEILNDTLEEKPDIIIVWESACDFLDVIFPDALVLRMSPGMLSRTPFPYMITIDPKGLFSNSIMRDPKIMDATRVEKNDIVFLDTLKKECFDKMSDWLTPFQRCELDPYDQFDQLYLLPLQVSHYFAFNGCCSFKTQLEFLEYVLSNVPSNIGIVVTNYLGKENVVHDTNYISIRKYFPNLIYRPDFNKFHQISQMLLPLVDGVITVSSSIGMQAAFLGKPVFVVGESHLSLLSASSDLGDVGKVKPKLTEEERIKFFTSVLSTMQFTQESLCEPNWLSQCLEKALEIKRRNGSYFDIIKCFENKDLAYRASLFNRTTKTYLNNMAGLFKMLTRADMKHIISKYNKIENASNILEEKDYKIISFDIFDTLVERKVFNPKTVFALMNYQVCQITNSRIVNFANIRVTAEKCVFGLLKEKDKNEILIDDIYDFLIENGILNAEEANEIKKLEIETEKKVIVPRKSGIRLFNRAKELGKRVILVSDMYLSERFIEEILESAGIRGYDKLYVSCDYNAKKCNGELFKTVLELEKISPKDILHIGDNDRGDILEAEKKGIIAYKLVKGRDYLFGGNTAYRRIFARREDLISPWESIYLGMVSSKFYSDQDFITRSPSHFNGSLFQLGYAGLGPIFVLYAIWLAKAAKLDGKENLFFLSREGLILKKVFDIVSPYVYPEVKTYYLHSSRSILRKNTIETNDQIYNITTIRIGGTGATLSDFLDERFGIIYDQIPKEILNKFPQFTPDYHVENEGLYKLLPFAFSLKEIIFQQAKERRELYLDYLSQIGFLSAPNKAVVDVGYLLSAQQLLVSLCKDTTIGGYYFASYWKAMPIIGPGIQVKSFLGDFLEFDYFGKTMIRAPILEVLILSDEGTTRGVTRNNEGKMIVEQDSVEVDMKRIELVSKAHSGAMEFAKDLVKHFGEHLSTIPFDPRSAFKMIDDFYWCPDPNDGKLLEGVVFENTADLCGVKYMVEPKEPGKDREESIKSSIWTQGARAFWRDQTILDPKMSIVEEKNTTIQKHEATIKCLTQRVDEFRNKFDEQSALLKERTFKLIETYRAYRARDGLEKFKNLFENQRQLLKERTDKLVLATRMEKAKAIENKKLKSKIETSLKPAIDKQKALLVERTNKLIDVSRQAKACEKRSEELTEKLKQKDKMLKEIKKTLSWYEKTGLKGIWRRVKGRPKSISYVVNKKIS